MSDYCCDCQEMAERISEIGDDTTTTMIISDEMHHWIHFGQRDLFE